MAYCKQTVKIKTKIKDRNEIKKLGNEILDFVNKHGICFDCGYNAEGEVIAVYETEGRKTAYCKVLIAEVKQLLKDTYKCKIEVILYMY